MKPTCIYPDSKAVPCLPGASLQTVFLIDLSLSRRSEASHVGNVSAHMQFPYKKTYKKFAGKQKKLYICNCYPENNLLPFNWLIPIR